MSSTLDRFEEKYIPKPMSGCWLWTGAVINSGYGAFHHDRFLLAHRWSYWFHKGEIPSDHVVRHRCDTKTCVNPDHLETGTEVENMQDHARRKSPRKTCAKGLHSWVPENILRYGPSSDRCRSCQLAKQRSWYASNGRKKGTK